MTDEAGERRIAAGLPLRSLTRKVAFAVILIAVACTGTLIMGEIGATLYYVAQPGDYVSPHARLEAQRNAYVEEARSGTCSYGDSLILHPYLGWGNSALGPCGWKTANSKSLIGREFPDNPIPRTGIILVTGGSVAAQFTWDNRQKPSALEKILNAEFTGDRFDRFIVLNGGHGAWKQPQQYILFGLYADVLAGVITLDGFNEHYQMVSSSRFEIPSTNFFETAERRDGRAQASHFSEAALVLDAMLYRFALAHRIFHLSNLAYFVIDSARAMARGGADTRGEEDWRAASYEKMFAFTDAMQPAEKEEWTLRQYAKYIRLMHAGANALGIPSLFLIQPTPAFDKRLTEHEQPFALQTHRDAYEKMTNYLVGLRQTDNLPVYSLLDVFKDTDADIYKDAAHVNELGNQIMAQRIADLIESAWGWPRKKSAAADM